MKEKSKKVIEGYVKSIMDIVESENECFAVMFSFNERAKFSFSCVGNRNDIKNGLTNALNEIDNFVPVNDKRLLN